MQDILVRMLHSPGMDVTASKPHVHGEDGTAVKWCLQAVHERLLVLHGLTLPDLSLGCGRSRSRQLDCTISIDMRRRAAPIEAQPGRHGWECERTAVWPSRAAASSHVRCVPCTQGDIWDNLWCVHAAATDS